MPQCTNIQKINFHHFSFTSFEKKEKKKETRHISNTKCSASSYSCLDHKKHRVSCQRIKIN